METWTKFKASSRFIYLLAPYRFKLVISIVCSGIISLLDLINPIITKIMMDNVYPERDFHLFGLLIAIGVSIYFIRTFLGIIRDYYDIYVERMPNIKLRSAFYKKLQTLPINYLENREVGEYMYRAQSDVGNVTTMTAKLIQNSTLLTFHLVILLIITIYLNWRLTVIALALIPLMQLNAYFSTRTLRSLNEINQRQLSNVNSILQQNISNMRIVRLFGKQKYEIRNYMQKLHENLRLTFKTWRVSTYYSIWGGLLSNLGSAGVVWFGWYQVLNDSMTIGSLMAVIVYVFQLYSPIQGYIDLYRELIIGSVSSERISEILDKNLICQESSHSILLDQMKGDVEFRHLYFGYDKRFTILKDISFYAKSGSIVSISGQSGTGKTTLASLLCGLFDPWQGEILIDGYNIKNIKLNSIYNQIAIVPQDGCLFSGTIIDNIRYGNKEATIEKVYEVAKFAEAHSFIMSFPEKYYNQVGERGSHLSGGEKQRIAIARALIRNPKILILDEATSFLDPEIESIIYSNLKIYFRNTTIFIIAHKFPKNIDADLNLILQNGKLMEY